MMKKDEKQIQSTPITYFLLLNSFDCDKIALIKSFVSVGRDIRFQGMAFGVGSPFERGDSFLFSLLLCKGDYHGTMDVFSIILAWTGTYYKRE
jgi:hypothetical protein